MIFNIEISNDEIHTIYPDGTEFDLNKKKLIIIGVESIYIIYIHYIFIVCSVLFYTLSCFDHDMI